MGSFFVLYLKETIYNLKRIIYRLKEYNYSL